MVVSAVRLGVIRWPPYWRATMNPFCSGIRQTSSPERTRRLPNRNLSLRHEDFAVKAAADFGRVRRYEKQSERLGQVRLRFFDRGALARDIEFRAKRGEAPVFAFDNCRQTHPLRHDPSLHQNC